MDRRRLRSLLALALATVAIPTAIAGAAESTRSAAPGKQVAKQVKALKSQAATLAGRLAGLQAAMAALEEKQPLPPDSAPPSGPAGGDLLGSYPNPQLRPGTVVSSDIANGTILGSDISLSTISASNVLDGTIGSVDIADDEIGLADLGPSSVGGLELVGTFVVRSDPNLVGGRASGGNAVSCPPPARLLSGGLEWEHPPFTTPLTDRLYPILSAPSELEPNITWEVAARNNSGQSRRLYAKALCLRVQ